MSEQETEREKFFFVGDGGCGSKIICHRYPFVVVIIIIIIIYMCVIWERSIMNCSLRVCLCVCVNYMEPKKNVFRICLSAKLRHYIIFKKKKKKNQPASQLVIKWWVSTVVDQNKFKLNIKNDKTSGNYGGGGGKNRL